MHQARAIRPLDRKSSAAQSVDCSPCVLLPSASTSTEHRSRRKELARSHRRRDGVSVPCESTARTLRTLPESKQLRGWSAIACHVTATDVCAAAFRPRRSGMVPIRIIRGQNCTNRDSKGHSIAITELDPTRPIPRQASACNGAAPDGARPEPADVLLCRARPEACRRRRGRSDQEDHLTPHCR